MKKIVSVSLGAADRNHRVIENIGGQEYSIERVGTDGDKQKAIQIIQDLDGKIDAFGLGGTDLYIVAGGRRYIFQESKRIVAAAKLTPIVDGSGLKNTLERRVVKYLSNECGIQLHNKKVLMVCGVDRFGLAEALVECGCEVVFGDLMFGLGIPLAINSLVGLAKLARVAAPVITRMPVSWFYPIGKEQNIRKPKFQQYFAAADVVAGDFHYIKRYMPKNMAGKIIITNTVTKDDEYLLKNAGITTLITTTPEMQGRSFGTNVLEAVLVTLAQKPVNTITASDYSSLLDDLQIKPRVVKFA